MARWKYGNPIPKKYRNRLYQWCNNCPWDGCLWTTNNGLVDESGHWHAIHDDGGSQGMSQLCWFEKKRDQLKAELGYDSTPVDCQHSDQERQALKEVFGDEWRRSSVSNIRDPRVMEKLKDENKRYEEYRRRLQAYRDEMTNRQDEMFMQVVGGQDKREDWQEVGRIDEKHIKKTCKDLCSFWSENVGRLAHILDGMARHGYEPWCTCSDCGEQFQNCDYECFSHSIDEHSYHGDGGIGVIYTRILCDRCRECAECPQCYSKSKPNTHMPDGGEKDKAEYHWFETFMLDWIGCCQYCAEGVANNNDGLYYWSQADGRRQTSELGDKLAEHLENCEVEDSYEGYHKDAKTYKGRIFINWLRDQLKEIVIREMTNMDLSEDSWFNHRYDPDPNQLKLDGVL